MSQAQQTQSETDVGGVRSETIDDEDDIFAAVEDLIDSILDAADDEEAQAIVTDYLEQAATLAVSRYSIQNQIALIKQLNHRDVDYKHDAKHFAGYNTWQNEHGRHVKKGETGYTILAPRIGLTCPECGNAPSYHKNEWLDCERAGSDPADWDIDPAEEWSEGVLYFTTATTFAYAQTAPLPDADDDQVFTPDLDDGRHVDANGEDAEELFDALREAAESGAFDVGAIEVEITGSASMLGLTSAGGSTGGSILVKTSDDRAEQFRTLVHEVAHELLHQNTRNPIDATGKLGKRVKETEAEAVAHAVTHAVGMEPSGSDLYVSAWTQHARNQAVDEDDVDAPREAIKHRLEAVQETAAEIVAEICAPTVE